MSCHGTSKKGEKSGGETQKLSEAIVSCRLQNQRMPLEFSCRQAAEPAAHTTAQPQRRSTAAAVESKMPRHAEKPHKCSRVAKTEENTISPAIAKSHRSGIIKIAKSAKPYR